MVEMLYVILQERPLNEGENFVDLQTEGVPTDKPFDSLTIIIETPEDQSFEVTDILHVCVSTLPGM